MKDFERKLFFLRRARITLLEIILVFAILALLMGIIGINISNTVIDQRFRNEVSRVIDQMRLAQDLMLILGTDVHLLFQEEKDQSGIKYWIHLENPLPKHWEKEILRPHPVLKTIRGIFFKDETVLHSPTMGKIDIKFLSGGSVMSKGVLRLSTSDKEVDPPKGTVNNYICLPGYPHSISSTDTSITSEDCKALNNESFDRSLTQDTMSKLPEKMKNLKEDEELTLRKE